MKRIDDFVPYRPEPPSHRLELLDENGNVVPKDVWKPSVSYKFALSDVKTQFTPAEYFRYRLVTSGKYIRMIQRLETRWKRNFVAWTKAALTVQAAYKGMKVRRFFHSIKDELMLELRQRRLFEATNIAFTTEKDYQKVIELSLTTEKDSPELVRLRMKSEYRLHYYQQCVASANTLLSWNRQEEDATYFKACCQAHFKQYQDCLDTIKDLMTVIPKASNHLFILYGTVCFETNPPQYENARDSFTEVINRNGRDFESVRKTVV
jgi:hypothetical protein